jgi:ATP-binding cassette subfamily B protein
VALSGVFDSAQAVLITVFGQKMTRRLRHDMCRKLTRLPAEYFTKNDAGTVASRFVGDADTVQTLFDDGVISMFADSCKVVSIIVVVFTRSVGLGLLLVITAPLIMWLTMAYRRWMLASQLKNRAAAAKVTNHVPETIRNIRMIHVFGKESYMERRYGEYIRESYRSREKSNLYDSTYSPIVVFTGAAVTAVMMVMAAMGGGMRSFFGMSVGTAVAVIAYVGKVFSPIESIGMEIENIQTAAAGARRIDDFLAAPERRMPDAPAPEARDDLPAVSLKNVRFGYGGEDDVLRDLSFDVERGGNVTLCGRTGAGKTTVFRLLLGLYPPRAGEVNVFGESAADIRDGDKRRLFGYVEQAFRKVPGTVGEQISLGDPDVGPDMAERAAGLAGLDEYIRTLPKGYDTPFSESLFSQGTAAAAVHRQGGGRRPGDTAAGRDNRESGFRHGGPGHRGPAPRLRPAHGAVHLPPAHRERGGGRAGAHIDPGARRHLSPGRISDIIEKMCIGRRKPLNEISDTQMQYGRGTQLRGPGGGGIAGGSR